MLWVIPILANEALFLLTSICPNVIHRLVANALDAIFLKGDAIAIDMPMTVNAVIIYIAIVLAGCVVVSIADSFAAKEIATRLRVSKAKGIFTQVIIYFHKSSVALKMWDHLGKQAKLASYVKIAD
jgi:acyl-coenzyme A synthetase/AMP-(fatty) acid ligase